MRKGENMARQAFADVLTEWEKLLMTVAANKDDLPYIDNYKQQLEVEMAGAKDANVRQSTSQAEAQQASRDLEGFLTRGHDLAERIRGGIRIKYGKRSEKLKEFGLKVFRNPKKKSSTVKPPQEAASAAEMKPAPQAATSEEHNPS